MLKKENNKYWYFRFTKDFFEDYFIDNLKDIPVVGYQYIVIYLEMCSLTLKQNGKEYLIIPKITDNPSYVNYIATRIREDYKTVDSAITLFRKNGYIIIEEKEGSFEVHIPKLKNNVGVSSKNADRMRITRNEQKLIGTTQDDENDNKTSQFEKF